MGFIGDNKRYNEANNTVSYFRITVSYYFITVR